MSLHSYIGFSVFMTYLLLWLGFYLQVVVSLSAYPRHYSRHLLLRQSFSRIPSGWRSYQVILEIRESYFVPNHRFAPPYGTSLSTGIIMDTIRSHNEVPNFSSQTPSCSTKILVHFARSLLTCVGF